MNSDEQYEKAPFLFHRPGFSLGAGRVPRQFALGTDLAKLLPLPTWGPSGFMSLSAQKGVEEHPQRQEVGEEVACPRTAPGRISVGRPAGDMVGSTEQTERSLTHFLKAVALFSHGDSHQYCCGAEGLGGLRG